MIEVKHLTKRYGSHEAVSDLSFTVEKGRIYGFLGPNGAGKSTAMNIITGCLGMTAGEVLIDGHNIMEEPLAAKKRIGYLPELPPVYMDMTVQEYLLFVAEAKALPHGERRSQVAGVMERTDITAMKDRLIRNLSKGYRQRVGIAQALLGNPEIIILDEPTVGLDPAQIIEIRQLIVSLGKEHTVILSSHILPEVQAVCDSIMILNRGRMVASDTPENLTRLLAAKMTIHLESKGTESAVRSALQPFALPNDTLALTSADDTVTVDITRTEDDADIRESLFRAFAAAGLPLLEMHTCRASLEDVFLELTQAHDEPPQGKKRGFRLGLKEKKAKADEQAEKTEQEVKDA